jgi:hypothetical protein
VGSNNPLRKELEKMFPSANGEEINTLMDLFILASQVDMTVEEPNE